MSAPGRFIVLEGIDGAGTTTQARRLEARIRETFPDRGVQVTAEPSGGPVGSLIRQVLRERVVGATPGGDRVPFDRRALALLFAADRLDHVGCEIRPLVDSGWVVISDRYLLSSLAYQGMDAPVDWVAEANRWAPAPDLLLFLDVRPDVGWRRVAASRAGREIFETPDTLRRVAEAYGRALPSCPAGRTVVVPGEVPVDEVAERIWAEVLPLLAGG
jgi:dTMP kinase